MNKARWLGLLLCIALIPGAQTQDEKRASIWESGNAFLSACADLSESSRTSGYEQGVCLGFVKGIEAGVSMAYDYENRTAPFCVPDEVTNGQMLRVLTKFITDHPEKAHYQTRVLELEALMKTFPCETKGKKK
jgi:hypothetical protein